MQSTATTKTLVQDVQVTATEVVAHFPSQSRPGSKPHESYVNRFTAKGRCDCKGYRTHKHCSHLEALTAVALEQNLIIKVRKGRRAEAKATIGKPNPFLKNTSDIIHALKVRQFELTDADLDEIAVQAWEARQDAVRGSDVDFVGVWF